MRARTVAGLAFLCTLATALPSGVFAQDSAASVTFGAEISHLRTIASPARDGGACPPSDDPESPHVCLTDGGRFSSAVTFGVTGPDGPEFVRAKPTATEALPDSATLWYFFGEDNPEMLIKLLNGCEINGYWWLFGSAATDRPWQVFIWDLHHIKDGVAQATVWGKYGAGPAFGYVEGTNGYANHVNLLADTKAIPCVPPED